MIEKLINEYLSTTKAATEVDYSNRKSVQQFNASTDRMRAIVDEVVGLGHDAILEFASLLDMEPAAPWVAHHLVEKTELDSATLSRCFSCVEQVKTEAESKGDLANAMGEEMWLNEWKTKRARESKRGRS